MSVSLVDLSALVVGASSGMGRATALELCRGGARVMAGARREDRLRQLQQEAAAAGLSLEVCPTDVTELKQIDNLVTAAMQRFGRIDLLVYASGTNIPERALEVLTPASWQMMLATNLTGAYLCTRRVLPVMRSAGGGLIVYLSTAAVQMPDVSGVAYQASKHGLSGLAHGTRVEEKKHGIRTSVVFPGLCDTEILNKRPAPTPQDMLDRALAPQDVAEAVVFLAQLHPRAVVPELQLLPSLL